MLAFHWVAGVVVVATALPGIIFQYRVAHRSWRVMNDTTPAVRRLNYLRDLVTQRRAAKEVRLFGLVPWIEARYGAEYAQYARDYLSSLRVNTQTNLEHDHRPRVRAFPG